MVGYLGIIIIYIAGPSSSYRGFFLAYLYTFIVIYIDRTRFEAIFSFDLSSRGHKTRMRLIDATAAVRTSRGSVKIEN